MTLFIHCYSKGHEALQETALQILSDMLMTHHSLLVPIASQSDSNSVTQPPFQKPLLKVFAKALKTSAPPSVQTAAVTSLSKLLLTNTLSPTGPAVPASIKELNENSVETLLQALVLSFFHPRTRDNLALRQALAYFLPVYCHSRLANAQHMRRVAVPVVRTVLGAADEFYSLEPNEDSDGEIDESAGDKEVKALMTGVIGMLTEWTDDRRIVGLGTEKQLPGTSIDAVSSLRPCESLHLTLAKDILQRILGIGSNSSASREEKKLLLSFLGKLYIPSPSTPSRSGSRVPESIDDLRSSTQSGRPEVDEESSSELPLTVKDLLDQAMAAGIAKDATGRNGLVKTKNAVLKLIAVARTEKESRGERGGKGKEQAIVKEEVDDEQGDETITAENVNGPDGDGDDTVIAQKPGIDREGETDAGTDIEDECKGE
jgi:condensin complex subunit 3